METNNVPAPDITPVPELSAKPKGKLPEPQAPPDLKELPLDQTEQDVLNELYSEVLIAQGQAKEILESAPARAKAVIDTARAQASGALHYIIKNRKLQGNWGTDSTRPGMLIKQPEVSTGQAITWAK